MAQAQCVSFGCPLVKNAFPTTSHNMKVSNAHKSVSFPRIHSYQPVLSQNRPFLAASCDYVHLGTSVLRARGFSVKAMSSLLVGDKLQSRIKVICGAASKPAGYPELTTKPMWWWRTLSSIPYLMPLHNAWSYAESIYQLQPVLEGYSSLMYPFLEAIMVMPSWLLLVLFMSMYFFVVRRKEWPHFLRFHVAMALLLDTGFQAIGTACGWMPAAVFKSNLMRYFWLAVAFAQMYTAVEGIRCALGGMYPNVPFLSHAASIHSDLKLLNF